MQRLVKFGQIGVMLLAGFVLAFILVWALWKASVATLCGILTFVFALGGCLYARWVLYEKYVVKKLPFDWHEEGGEVAILSLLFGVAFWVAIFFFSYSN